jgi:hypothetical protein
MTGNKEYRRNRRKVGKAGRKKRRSKERDRKG